jgi:ATP-dependent Clp protease adaptor protein ClpS
LIAAGALERKPCCLALIARRGAPMRPSEGPIVGRLAPGPGLFAGGGEKRRRRALVSWRQPFGLSMPARNPLSFRRWKCQGYAVTGMSNPVRGTDGGTVGQIVTKTKDKTDKPSLYKVLLLNDDYTPMEFVVHVLERFFSKTQEDATRIMLHVHNHGVGICGVFTYEIAETKVSQVMDFARQHQHPLQCTMEKD